MRKRLIAALVGVAAVILLVFGVPLTSFVAKVERERLVTAMERDAFILAGHAKETLNTTSGSVLPSLQPYLYEHSSTKGTRALVTNSTGLIVASMASGYSAGQSGITLTNGANGTLTFPIHSPQTSGWNSGPYATTISRLDSGYSSVLFQGYLLLSPR